MKPKVIAYYLPQFYPTPENDLWWGEGFTEWTNVKNARPLFKNHLQPKLPGELGFYNLLDPVVRQMQADLASTYGVYGFCYWHYWFGNGKRLLYEVFDAVLESGTPALPFCLAWANHSWEDKKFNKSGTNKLLIKQEYPGEKDWVVHFHEVLRAFKDSRYIRVNDMPVFVIHRAWEIPDCDKFIKCWQDLAKENGIPGIHFIAILYHDRDIPTYLEKGFSAVNIIRLFHFVEHLPVQKKLLLFFQRKILNQGMVFDYAKCYKYFSNIADEKSYVYPTIIPNWDHSPRSGRRENILINSTPGSFKKHVLQILATVWKKDKRDQLVFLKSWNEWAEGNYMEPDQEWSRGYLEALLEGLSIQK